MEGQRASGENSRNFIMTATTPNENTSTSTHPCPAFTTLPSFTPRSLSSSSSPSPSSSASPSLPSSAVSPLRRRYTLTATSIPHSQAVIAAKHNHKQWQTHSRILGTNPLSSTSYSSSPRCSAPSADHLSAAGDADDSEQGADVQRQRPAVNDDTGLDSDTNTETDADAEEICVDVKPALDWFLTVEEGLQFIRDGVTHFNGDVTSFAEKCASGFVDAFQECYDQSEATMVFVVVGHGLNGFIGLHIAVALSQLGYETSIYAPYGNRHINTTGDAASNNDPDNWNKQTRQFCARHELPVYDFIPSTLSFYFDVVVDALLSVGYDGGDIRPYYWPVYEMLITTELPLASVDVPSGWDLSLGPRSIDLTADTFVKPDLLVSLGAPKLGTRLFAGEFHFVAGRDLVADGWFTQLQLAQEKKAVDEIKGGEKGKKRVIKTPSFKGQQQAMLLYSNARPFGKLNGEVYGKPGQFQATLFTKNPKRTWVDFEEEEEDITWDEFE